MVKHVILWKLKASATAEDKLRAKTELEALGDKLEGLIEIKVRIDGLDSSTADMMLDSTFTDAEALEAYQHSPEHVLVAENYVRPIVETRLCLDFND